MDEKQLKRILETYRTIAVVGLSTNPDKISYGVTEYMQRQGYRIIPVNPTADEILGEKAYPDLTSIPDKVDIVQVFRRPEDVPPVVDEAIRIGAKVVWMQEGIRHEAAAKKARAAGLEVVMDLCIRNVHRWLIGER